MGGIEGSIWQQVDRSAKKLAFALNKLGLVSGDKCATIAWNNLA